MNNVNQFVIWVCREREVTLSSPCVILQYCR